jgi:hypothetical protein
MIKGSINIYGKIIIFILLVLIIWWVFINMNSYQNAPINFFYGAGLGLLVIVSSVFGLINVRKWGGLSSVMGRAIIFLSLGLLAWGIGTLVFAYYNIFLNIEVPYPSIADGFYIVSWPLWLISMVNLYNATGAKFQLKKISGRLIIFVIPLVTITLSYFMLVIVARGGISYLSGDSLKIFFDLAYPIGDVVILTVAILIYSLSFNYLGGRFKWPIVFVIMGFIVNYIADFAFSYTTTKGIYFVANWVDFIFTIAMFLIGFGVSLMGSSLEESKTN